MQLKNSIDCLRTVISYLEKLDQIKFQAINRLFNNKIIPNGQKISLVVVGSPQSGKSTLVGNIIHTCHGIHQKDFEKLDSNYAWVATKHVFERKNGYTADFREHEIVSGKHFFTIIDTPGRQKYLKNMLSAVSISNAAILVVDVSSNESTIEEDTKMKALVLFT